MGEQIDIHERIASLLNEVAVNEGQHPTIVDGVQVTRTSTPSKGRTPVIYQPKIIIVGQGRKRGHIGDKVYQYDLSNYLVLLVPMPAECEWDTSPEEPVLAISIGFKSARIGEIILEMDELSPPVDQTPLGISSTPMTEELGGSVVRLLECLKNPRDSRMLGRPMVQEIIYRVLQGEQGGALRALASRDEHFSRIARVLNYVNAEYSRQLSVEELARKAGMRLAAFHHHFKLVTASSPIQYIKRIRLEQARVLMAHDGYNASTAARAVGYESSSQFSREFKRLFGVTPIEEAEQMRSRLVAS